VWLECLVSAGTAGFPRRFIAHEEGRWQAHWIDDGAEEKLVFYCPECAEREFEER
jgi:hypothetical protein